MYIFIHIDHWWHLVYSKVIISLGNCSLAVSMATCMHMDERSLDCLGLCPNNQDRKGSVKIDDYAWHNLYSGYRELLLNI